MMKLTGIGDPSGVGEAYNFLREADSRSNKATASNSDGALNEQIKKITGTQNDLRKVRCFFFFFRISTFTSHMWVLFFHSCSKLTMKQMASLLRSYGMKDKQIMVLKRWDRQVTHK